MERLGVWVTRSVWHRIGGFLAADIAQAYLRQFYNYPVWAILIVTLSVFTIWALTAHGRDIAMA